MRKIIKAKLIACLSAMVKRGDIDIYEDEVETFIQEFPDIDIYEDEVETFLEEFLSQLGGDQKRSKKVLGHVSGYILFSLETRNKVKDENPEITCEKLGFEVGKRWKALSDDSKKKWNDKAFKQNEDVDE